MRRGGGGGGGGREPSGKRGNGNVEMVKKRGLRKRLSTGRLAREGLKKG